MGIIIVVGILWAYIAVAYFNGWWPFPKMKFNVDPEDPAPAKKECFVKPSSDARREAVRDYEPLGYKKPQPEDKGRPKITISLGPGEQMHIALNENAQKMVQEDPMKEAEGWDQKYGRSGTA